VALPLPPFILLEAGASRFATCVEDFVAADGATDEFHQLMSMRAGATPAPPFSLDVLRSTMQRTSRSAAASDATPPRQLQALQDAARLRGIELLVFRVSKPEDIVPAINDAKAAGAEALNFLATPLFSVPGSPNSRVVIEQVAAVRLPAIYQWPETAEQGGLAGYGPRFTQIYRQRARMVIKILRGAKPADIPVEQPALFELVVNLKTAKAIGHEVPAALVERADLVIE
jgi:putative tryptophan/tyrosine transport system substrate-binding protein